MENAALSQAAPNGAVQVISLNALKRGADNNYHKLEIPIALAKSAQIENESLAFCGLRVDPLTFNSNCSLEFSYAFGKTQVLASLQGPSEAKFGSKADYSKAFIEVNLRVPQTDTESHSGT